LDLLLILKTSLFKVAKEPLKGCMVTAKPKYAFHPKAKKLNRIYL
jgi:hypothetical protein